MSHQDHPVLPVFPGTPTVVDIFCGAGGLSLGFKRADFVGVLALDHFNAAVDTYRANLGNHVRSETVSWDTKVPRSDVIVGGPPCQGFSSAGRRTPGDARNTLVAAFAHIIARERPQAFVFENVEGFLTGDDGRWVTDLLDPLIAAGYCIHLRKVNAANYGVPQHRKRVLGIGGLGWDPGFPVPTYRATGAPGAELIGEGLPPCPTVAEALAGLSPAVDDGDSTPSDHRFTAPNDMDRLRFEALQQGQTMKDLPENLWHETYRRRAHRRVCDGTPTERRGGAPSGLRRLRADEPSKAITSGARSEFVHPTEHRTLTLRECARLQTFPDDHEFFGTQSDRALLIGNAVPPVFATAVANHLRVALAQYETRRATPGLLSFVATNASAMSPALRRVVETVEARYLGKQPTAQPMKQMMLGGW